MIGTILLKKIVVYGEEQWMWKRYMFQVLPQPDHSIYVGPGLKGEYDEDNLREHHPVWHRATDIYVIMDDHIWTQKDERETSSQDNPYTMKTWLDHYRTFGYRTCTEPRPSNYEVYKDTER